MRLKYQSTSKAHVLTARIPRVVVCAIDCMNHTSKFHGLMLQSTVAFPTTYYIVVKSEPIQCSRPKIVVVWDNTIQPDDDCSRKLTKESELIQHSQIIIVVESEPIQHSQTLIAVESWPIQLRWPTMVVESESIQDSQTMIVVESE